MVSNALTAERLADALLYGGHVASVENFMLSDDADIPIYPESLVQVEVARVLKERLQFSNVELEADTDALVHAASGCGPGSPNFAGVVRRGSVDIVCWRHFVPQVFVEVKDQISGTDDGIVSDMMRLQELLLVSHRWGADSPQARTVRFGAVLYFVGKNSARYREGKRPYLASHFMAYADRSVATSLRNLRKVVDESKFNLLVKQARVMDSAKDGTADPVLVGTEDEETVSGHEQFNVCVACVISAKTAPTDSIASHSAMEPQVR